MGKRPPSPEVTNMSPCCRSALRGMFFNVSSSRLPVPLAMARMSLRMTRTGSAWLRSVINNTRLVVFPTLMTCPTTPRSLTTGWPSNTPLRSPRSITT